MEHPIRSGFAFFGHKYERILLLILFILLPAIIFQFFASNYILAITPTFGAVFSIADVYNAYIVLTLFFFMQVPFLYFWHYEESGDEKPLRKSFYQFLINGFHFFVFSAAIGFLVTLGFSLFVLPGVILLAIFISAPVIAIMDGQSVWTSVRESFRIFKLHHWKIVLLLATFSLIEIIISTVMQIIIIDITTSFLAIAICHIFLNTVFLPLFYLVMASFVAKWRQDLSFLEIADTEFPMSDSQ